jgi:NAD(P)-dependent dehydrogenase (short-subunit alcohol dehydrogenase family)
MSSRGRTAIRRIGLAVVGLPPLLALPAAAMYRENHRPKLPNEYTLQDLSGKTVVATGASSGIGRAAVAKLRDLGATVLSGSRSEGNLDLADISSVKEFAKSIEKCDMVLACAAEIYTEKGETSVDGFDKTFATNHIGLQALLEEIEKRKLQPSRLVVVGSKLERNGLVDPDIVRKDNGKRLNDRPGEQYTAVKHYGDTKLCNQMLTTALVERWPETKVFSVSPGMVDTGLWRNFSTWFQILTWPVRKVALRTSEDAALGVVYACASEEAGEQKSGTFFVDGRAELASEDSRDAEKARRLWKVVEDLIRERVQK